jgi:hypothetical protein
MPDELDSPLHSQEAPNLVVPIPDPYVTSDIPMGSSQYLYLSGWYLGKQLLVDHLTKTSGNQANHLMQRITFPLQTEIPPHSQGESISSTIWDLERLPDLNETQDYRLCEGRFISVFTDRANIRVIVVPEPTPVVVQPSPPNSHVAAPLIDIAISPHLMVFSFDPTSGRLCGFTNDNELVIYDFLKQPLPSIPISQTTLPDF